ncbi:hypothetical protein BH09VER1_BH09VER1_10060 [soil metagenome]
MLTEKSSDSPEEENTEVQTEPVAEETVEAPPEEIPPPELLETVPVSDERIEAAGASGQLLEACPACGTLMDVTEQPPFAKIFCPSCGQSLRARKQFNNYKLIEQIGEGGMGSVFKALDCNLHRNVALKILKKEFSADEEGKAKLEQEARVTASINHPHVVKVFSFGEDHGQFYLAMELVEKGSLDQLMGIQRKVAEVQMLEVGIQIAQGLEAGFEHELIHRDIKPGNILFADPHTAKLVDFGLAIVMDEAASAKGEIWGTPYYIAPEKLDHQSEDLRSDIYSLGGTLFHALAGRPPYEAETASMVALKQLKSQPVSLQAFAPEVSSETAYVINRMLAKNKDDRYATYQELIEHLSYARHKLLERAQKPLRPKERVVLETQATRNLTAFLSLGLLLALLLCGLTVFLLRDKLFGGSTGKAKAAEVATHNASEFMDMFKQSTQLLVDRQFDEAATSFGQLASSPGLTQPLKNWSLMNQGLALTMNGDKEKASPIFQKLAEGGLFSTDEKDSVAANLFINAGKVLADPDKKISRTVDNLYSNQNAEAFALLCFGLHDWQLGAFTDAGPLLKTFLRSHLDPADSWIDDYKPLAKFYVADWDLLKPLEDGLSKATDAASAQALLKTLQAARAKVQTGSQVTDRLDAIEQQLKAKGAK